MDNRLKGLDALRGLAALAVLVQHHLLLIAVSEHQWVERVISAVDLGKFGVSLFFLISGFVIPFSVGRGLQQFWLGRAFRLLPALWFSIAFALILGVPIDSLVQLFANAFMITEMFGEKNLLPVYWTLNWELYFYLIVSGLFACSRQSDARCLCYLSIFFCALSLVHPFTLYLSMMIIGSLLNVFLLKKDQRSLPWLVIAFGAFFVAGFCWSLTDFRPVSFYLGVVLAVPVFLLTWNRLNNALLIWFGSISYSLYLLHFPILKLLSGYPIHIATIWGIGSSILISWSVFRWVEKPMITLGKRLAVNLQEHSHALTVQD